eukprot:1552877-Prymnesium_polylepis.1
MRRCRVWERRRNFKRGHADWTQAIGHVSVHVRVISGPRSARHRPPIPAVVPRTWPSFRRHGGRCRRAAGRRR